MAESVFETDDRSRKLPHIHLGQSKIEVSITVVGLESKHVLEACNSVILAPEIAQNVGAIEIRDSMVRTADYGPIIGLYGLIKAAKSF